MSARLRRAWRALWRARPHVPKANAECPVCGRAVVIAATTMVGNRVTGPMFSPATREEKIAACPQHGRSPYNQATIQAELKKR